MVVSEEGEGEGEVEEETFEPAFERDSDEFNNSFAGEVMGLGETGGIFLSLFCSLALPVIVWYCEARYAPPGMESKINIYTPKSSFCLKVENMAVIYIVYLISKVGNLICAKFYLTHS